MFSGLLYRGDNKESPEPPPRAGTPPPPRPQQPAAVTSSLSSNDTTTNNTNTENHHRHPTTPIISRGSHHQINQNQNHGNNTISWKDAHDETCRQNGLLFCTLDDVIRYFNHQNNNAKIKCPTSSTLEGIVVLSNENIIPSIRQALQTRMGKRNKSSTTADDDAAAAEKQTGYYYYVRDSTKTIVSAITTPVKQTARILLLSPVQYVVDTMVVGVPEYTIHDDEEMEEEDEQRFGSSPSPSLLASSRTGMEQIPPRDDLPPDEPILAVDFAIECLQTFEQKLAGQLEQTPTIVPNLQTYLQEKLVTTTTATSSSTKNIPLSESHMQILIQCLSPETTTMSSSNVVDSSGFVVQYNEQRNVYVIGNDPNRSIDVRLTLYDLDRNIDIVQTNLQRYTDQMQKAGQQALLLRSQQQQPRASTTTSSLLKHELAKYKLYKNNVESTQNVLLNLLQTREAVDAAAGQTQVLQALTSASSTLQALRKDHYDVEGGVDVVVDDLQEELENMENIQQTLASVNANYNNYIGDDDDLLQELENFSINDNNDDNIIVDVDPTITTTVPPPTDALPDPPIVGNDLSNNNNNEDDNICGINKKPDTVVAEQQEPSSQLGTDAAAAATSKQEEKAEPNADDNTTTQNNESVLIMS